MAEGTPMHRLNRNRYACPLAVIAAMVVTCGAQMVVAAPEAVGPPDHPEAGPAATVTLAAAATVADSVIRLQDVGDLALADDFAYLKSLVVAVSPLPRHERVLTAGHVATKLAQAGLREREFHVVGAKRIKVRRSGRLLTAHELCSALEAAFGQPVRVLSPVSSVVLPDGKLVVDAARPEGGQGVVSAKLLVDGRSAGIVHAFVRLGESCVRPPLLTRPATSKACSPPLVERREKVQLIATSGGASVRAAGVALQQGALGDQVLVSVTWTPKPLRGRITGPGEVTLSAW